MSAIDRGPTNAEKHVSRCMAAAQSEVEYANRGDVVMAEQSRRTLIDLCGGRRCPRVVTQYLRSHGH